MTTVAKANGRLTQVGYAAVTQAAVEVGATSTSVAAANADRKYLLLVNDSDTDIYVNLTGGAAALHAGVLLKPGGGFYEMTLGSGNVSTTAVRAIHEGVGAKVVLVTEGI
ncbi:MAG: hypothetical protein ACYDBB_27040 [Armatimonadota bacterium]